MNQKLLCQSLAEIGSTLCTELITSGVSDLNSPPFLKTQLKKDSCCWLFPQALFVSRMKSPLDVYMFTPNQCVVVVLL